ncbi:MAG: DEAD/DEAH box helicase [Actinobacteria bacterium]|uniref:RNA helicase n=1 Tax=freshwater metagenome TaxID=449393 RepID=A0A6J6IDD0_9ZZZZ|nr:DEAD/DEAH box helicase [Actinomycetota bacterium]
MATFRELGVLDATADALEAAGIIEAFPIQEQTLPLALAGTDLIGQAKTGTGKTLGFGIPLLQRITAPADAGGGQTTTPQALVIVPTRELCVQVAKDLELAGARRNVRVLAVYGGRAYEPQVAALSSGVDVVIGTPGRLIDLAKQRHLDLSDVKILVLDEADEMLDLGFLPDVEHLVSLTNAKRQTMLFSATMPGQIINLARRYMTQPTHIRATDPDDAGSTVLSIEQHVWRAHALDKVELVARILQAEGRGLSMIFCRTKRTAQKVADDLTERGFAAGAVHGDLGQGAREQALRAFRSGKVDVLVATDVAARGIDVQDVTHVINYQCPEDAKIYVHRIGRTGRAGASGVAISFVDWDDIPRWQLINKELGLAFHDPIETYSSSEHVYTGLGIPTDATGKLPSAQRTRAGLGAEKLEDLGETGRKPKQSAPQRSKPSTSPRSPSKSSAPAPAREKSDRPQRSRNRTRGGKPAQG